MLNLVKINPMDNTGLLLPFVGRRILDFARQHDTESDPEIFARMILARLVAGDPGVLVIAMVGAKGDVVGHGVATHEAAFGNQWAYVWQMRVDPGEGSSDPTAVKRCIEACDAWASERQLKQMVMASPRSDEAWRRKYGFKTLRHVMGRGIGSPIPGPAKD